MTLIELMVALVVALLVLGAVALVFAATSRSRGDLERSARVVENAHYAMGLLRDEIAQAGYYDALSLAGVVWQTPDPCATALNQLGWQPAVLPAIAFNAPVPIYGYKAADADPACLPNRKEKTAILVVRYVGPDASTAMNGTAFLQVSKCRTESPSVWVFSNKPADFTMHDITCATAAETKRFVVRIYYVADCDECGTDTIPTLKRAELSGNKIVVTSLAQGVENLQLEYGIDSDGDGTPNQYLAAPDVSLGAGFGEWSNVMAARVYLLVRSTEVEPRYKDTTKQFYLGPAGYLPAANDGFKRVLLTSVVRPMDPAGRRETQ